MNELINPRTGEKINKTKGVLLFGLTEEQTEIVLCNLPSSDIEVYDCSDCFSDIIATNYLTAIINPEYLTEEHIEYFNELYAIFSESKNKLLFTSPHLILEKLVNEIKYIVFYNDFEIETKIKYVLLDATREDKKMKIYSDTISQTIKVLSEIRKHPYITTAELATIIERTPRTVQRYITTLVCAGEFIEYDRKKKGWYIFENKSVLWGDYD